jgi:hypothetical protein
VTKTKTKTENHPSITSHYTHPHSPMAHAEAADEEEVGVKHPDASVSMSTRNTLAIAPARCGSPTGSLQPLLGLFAAGPGGPGGPAPMPNISAVSAARTTS